MSEDEIEHYCDCHLCDVETETIGPLPVTVRQQTFTGWATPAAAWEALFTRMLATPLSATPLLSTVRASEIDARAGEDPFA